MLTDHKTRHTGLVSEGKLGSSISFHTWLSSRHIFATAGVENVVVDTLSGLPQAACQPVNVKEPSRLSAVMAAAGAPFIRCSVVQVPADGVSACRCKTLDRLESWPPWRHPHLQPGRSISCR